MAKAFSYNEKPQSGWQQAEFPRLNETGIYNDVPRLFLFAAGGTGMRVVSSCVMLCACGFLKDVEVIPVLFDIDENCSSLNYAISELELYYKIYKEAERQDTSRFFFDTSISPIIIRSNKKSALSLNHTFKFDVHIDEKRIRECIFMDEHQHSSSRSRSAALKLADSLLGKLQDNSYSFSHGFAGPFSSYGIRMSVGNLEEYVDFKQMVKVINPAKDRVVIVGSAFGCTGTAFIYELTRALNNSWPKNILPKALVLMEPYFQVRGDKHTDNLTYDNMMERAKASMCFFDDCNLYEKMNVTYMIGAGTGFNVESISEGGTSQKNPNSIHEFIGAMAIVDFCRREIESKTEILTYAIPQSSDDKIYITDLLRTSNESSAMNCLTRFALAMKFIKNNENATIPLKLREFCSMFCQWIYEMEKVSHDSFVSFDLDSSEMHFIIKGKKYVVEDLIYSITHPGKLKPLFTLEDFIGGMATAKKHKNENNLDFLLRQLESGANALMEYISF